MEPLLIVLAAVEGAALVTTTALWRRARRKARSLQAQLESGRERRRLPSGRDAVKAVLETAALVREKGVGAAIRSSVEDLAGWAEVERPDLARLAARDGTVTIFFSDIQDSTALNEQLGDRGWVRVLGQHDRIVRGRVDRHGGHVVKTQGDGFMVAFGQADAAVRCGIAVQQALAGGTLRFQATPIRVRIGIHKGEAVHRDGDLFGRNVALAARVAAQADGGEILVSEAVRSAVDTDDVVFGVGRQVELKGLPGPHHVYTVEWA